ncbi:MAG: septum formation initiator family protein [Opitutales bacterium]|jgi:cell division protein FtsB
MRTAQLLNILFISGLLAVGCFAGSDAFKRYEKLQAARGTEAEAQRNLELLDVKTESRKIALERLKHDPEYVEKIIRQKLNYAKEDEVVFKFEFDDR